uniref:Tripartite motif-containing protein 3 n=1 Tax=Magallana gigas TaxID=29159 RepID=K1R594_MAGGI
MDTEELVNKISPTYKKISLELENQLANLNGGYEKLTTTMFKQGEQWHREIDIVINKMITEISEIKVKHRDILKKHLDEIKQIQSFIKQTLLALKEIEKSTEVSSTIEYSSKITEFSKFPPKVQVLLPTFTPNPIDSEKLYRMFGQIIPSSTDTGENIVSLNRPNTSFRELLNEPELVAIIQTGHKNLRSVTCLNEDRIWTRNTKLKCIRENRNRDICVADSEAGAVVVVNQDGKLRWRYTGHPSVTKNKPFKPYGITTDSQSHILTTDCNNHCIHILDQNGRFLRCIDNCDLEAPLGLCVDNNDNLFVCEYYKGNYCVMVGSFAKDQERVAKNQHAAVLSVNTPSRYHTSR